MSHPQIKNRTLFFNSNFDCQIIWPGLSELGDVKLRPHKIIESKDVKKKYGFNAFNYYLHDFSVFTPAWTAPRAGKLRTDFPARTIFCNRLDPSEFILSTTAIRQYSQRLSNTNAVTPVLFNFFNSMHFFSLVSEFLVLLFTLLRNFDLQGTSDNKRV